MAKVKKHKNYEGYEKMILELPAYNELLQVDSQFGDFSWYGPLATPKGKARREWWKKKCQEHNIDINQKGCYAQIALAIHPTKKHVCQCCGKELSLEYVYPKVPVIKKINEILGTCFKQTDYTIQEIVNTFCTTQQITDDISKIFKGAVGLDQARLITHIEGTGSTYLSPGAMSDSPDRFDGFHSYGLCCRKVKDKGRHDANMKLYGQDRRAYEEWADGDWNKANKLMSAFHNAPKMICPKCNSKTKRAMTADHVGPISLGFCHSPHFAPMCRSCNSSQNNRLYKSDVNELLKLESQGESVVSWHSKYVWDKTKNNITNDDDAFTLSKIMNVCHKNVLYLFYLIYSATGKDFLMRYLHPDYALFNHQIKNLDLSDLSKFRIISKPSNRLNKQKNRERYIRVAFESLTELGQKKNRKVKMIVAENDVEVQSIISQIKQGRDTNADNAIKTLINRIADSIINSYTTI